MFHFKNLLRSAVPSHGGEALGVAREQIESFYQSLGEGLRILENSLPPDTLSFRVEWLQLAVDFLHRVQSNTFLLIEKLYLENSKARSDEFLNEYLDVSKSLLDMCNSLKDGLSQVEMYHWSLELALERLTATSQSLFKEGEQGLATEVGDLSQFFKPLYEAGRQLDKLQTSKSFKSAALQNIFSSQHCPLSSQDRKKKRDVSLLLYDVHLVTSFVSCFLLWVLTGHGESISDNVDALEPSPKLKRSTSWSAFMFRLKEKVSVEQSFQNLESTTGQMKLQDVKNFQSSLVSLRTELTEGLSAGKLAPGSAFAGRMNYLLTEEQEKLGELSGSLSRISSQLTNMYTEILQKRKKVLDRCERSLFSQTSV